MLWKEVFLQKSNCGNCSAGKNMQQRPTCWTFSLRIDFLFQYVHTGRSDFAKKFSRYSFKLLFNGSPSKSFRRDKSLCFDVTKRQMLISVGSTAKPFSIWCEKSIKSQRREKLAGDSFLRFFVSNISWKLTAYEECQSRFIRFTTFFCRLFASSIMVRWPYFSS